MAVKVKFCGAAGTVTGSCFWVTTDHGQFLVECGLFQGAKTVKELNYLPFPFDASKIDFTLLTHAHTDHSAQVPKLIKEGFEGPVYTTPATRDLLRFMLPDSGYIQEIEVKRLNQRNQQRGKATVQPTYTKAEAEACLKQIRAVDYDTWIEPAEGFRVRFWNAGHILGSSSIEIEVKEDEKWMRLLFSGDLGPENKLLHTSAEAPSDIDYVFCETTYGGRVRPDTTVEKRRALLAKEINDAMDAGGNLIIPSFAVERSQELLLDIAYLLRRDEIPCKAVFLDSPLAIKITSVFSEYAEDMNIADGNTTPFDHPLFYFTQTVDESKSINRFSNGAIILAASGMCDAGRIRHHLKANLWQPQTTILLVGYQAEGTLGYLLENGAKNVKIQGEDIKVRAKINTIDCYSGHADSDGLFDWLEERQPIHQNIFLIHGSSLDLQSMRERLLNAGHGDEKVIIPDIDDEYSLSLSGLATKLKGVKRRLEASVVDKPDWHNMLAQLTIDIRNNLEKASSDQKRVSILNNLNKAISETRKKKTK